MSRLFTVLLLFALAACGSTPHDSSSSSGAASSPMPVAIEVTNSLRIPAHRVKIALEKTGKLNVEIQDRGRDAKNSSRIISSEEIARVQTLLRLIDWRAVSKDDVLGLDGTSVRVSYQGEKYSVWTPSHDTAKRKLQDYLRLKNELFGLAGLGESGLPR